MNFSFVDHTVSVKRLSAYSGGTIKLSGYTTILTDIVGLFEPVGQDQVTLGFNIQGQAFKFSCSGDIDIRANDKIIYNNEEYTVRGTQHFSFRSIDVLYCYLDKPQKQ